jgi:hypothetical protein
MLPATTTLGELLAMAKAMEPQHGTCQGIILSRTGVARVFYVHRTMHFTVGRTAPASDSKPQPRPTQP